MAPKLARAARSNSRQALRRAAVSELNTLASELGVQPMPVKGSRERVGTLVRDLDRACGDESTAVRVRAAANRYLSNGGVLPAKLRPECSDAGDPAPGYQLQRHRVLEEGFRLQAKAFMMTFNSRAFTIGTWGPFSTWVKASFRPA